MRTENKVSDFINQLTKIANEHQLTVSSIKSGFVDKGVDFGSYSVKPIEVPTIGVMIGEDFSSLSVGEVWHFFEQQLKCSAHLIWQSDLDRSLKNINTLIIPEGQHGLSENQTFLNWVKDGGHAIVMGNSATGFCKEEFG
ncbi:MAG: hypothetical protein ACKN86_08740, partial [Crocinitomicaceae bacterium]